MHIQLLQQIPAVKQRVRHWTYNLTEARIVEASVQLFSRLGYAHTSTREIALVAGVSEITVFRHFPRKRDLFWAATESRLRRLQVDGELGGLMKADEDPRVALPRFVKLLVDIIQQQPETLRLLYVSLFELDDGSEKLIRNHLLPLFESSREYLSRCVAKGLLRDVEPVIATLSLLASVAAQHELQPLVTSESYPAAGTEQAITALTTFWLKALLPEAVVAMAETPKSRE